MLVSVSILWRSHGIRPTRKTSLRCMWEAVVVGSGGWGEVGWVGMVGSGERGRVCCRLVVLTGNIRMLDAKEQIFRSACFCLFERMCVTDCVSLCAINSMSARMCSINSCSGTCLNFLSIHGWKQRGPAQRNIRGCHWSISY